ncbi:MAG: ribonuclease P protein component [Flavobacteriales bacterium]|nr:ribonuclease P protein component [Flavobacteriales bacterium]
MLPFYSFPKAHRLCHKKDIEQLFSSGKSFFVFPLLIHYKKVSSAQTKVLISVSKRKIRLATKRNRMKRLIREAFRLYLPDLIKSDKQEAFHIAITYVHDEETTLEQIRSAMLKGIKMLMKEGGNVIPD